MNSGGAGVVSPARLKTDLRLPESLEKPHNDDPEHHPPRIRGTHEISGLDLPHLLDQHAPARAAVVTRLGSALEDILETPAVVRKLDEAGVIAAPAPQVAFARFIAEETARWGAVIREAGLSLE